MDDRTRDLLNTLVESMSDNMRRVAGLSARLAITNQIAMRLVARTDLLADMTDEERANMERVLDASLSTADLHDAPEVTQAYVGLVRLRLTQLNEPPGQ